MTTSMLGTNLANGNGRKCDDLTKIKGIEPIKQQWLRESLNIYTFRDLAHFSVDAIEAQLQADWHSVSRIEIQDWIAQAQQLVAATELLLQRLIELSFVDAKKLFDLPPVESEASELMMESTDAQAEELSPLPTVESESCELMIESDDAQNKENYCSSIEEDEWQSFASFKVEFQSRQRQGHLEEQRLTVHCLETEQSQVWSSLERDSLQDSFIAHLPQWMLERISEGMQQSSDAQSPVAALLVSVEIDQIRLFQPLQTRKPMVVQKSSRVFPYAIASSQPFALELSFSLAGLNAANVAKKQVAYHAQVYACHRVTGAIALLSDAELGTLTEGQLSYQAKLAPALLEPGIYRLQAIVKLQDVPATPGGFKVPLLQVV
jgi:hypothetical protein